MAFCSNCGSELIPGARFCSNCGAAAALIDDVVVAAPESVVVAPEPAVVTAPAVNTVPVYTATGDMDYSVVLYSIGTCARSYADDVLEDILGYTDSEAKQLIKTVPVQIAQYLTKEQAQYIAQACTEYGMQLAVYKGQTPVDLSQTAVKSVFNSDGSLVSGVLSAIAAITVANRVRQIRRWTMPNLLRSLFAPRYHVTPPRHVTRVAPHRAPEPARQPAPRRVSIPQQTPKRRMSSSPMGNGRTGGFGGNGRTGAPGGNGRTGGPGGGGKAGGGRGR